MPEPKMRNFEAETRSNLGLKPAGKTRRQPASTLEEALASQPRDDDRPQDEGQVVNRLIAFLKTHA